MFITVYVPSSSACNQLNFQFGTAAATNRNFQIKVTQYSCNFNNLAPDGCTKYFFGSNTGTSQTYNYNGGNGQHLANQNEAQCFRREQGNCRICFARVAAGDFVVSGPTAAGAVSLVS